MGFEYLNIFFLTRRRKINSIDERYFEERIKRLKNYEQFIPILF